MHKYSTSENQHDIKKIFLEHIFKVRSFYVIYFLSVFFEWSFRLFFFVNYGDYSFGILLQCIPQLRSVVLLIESKDHKTFNSIFKMSA